jgi:hypothetical protein
MKKLIAYMVALAVLIGLMVFVGAPHFRLRLASTAYGHEFYDPWCRNGEDCQPTKLGDVTWTPQGWDVHPLKTIVPFSDIRIRLNPPDVPDFAICEYPAGKLRCLYVPEPQG